MFDRFAHSSNALLRKSHVMVLQLAKPVILARTAPSAYQQCPPVLINSVPKSGTHLLRQVVESLPRLRWHGTFLASTPSIRFRVIPHSAINRRLSRLVPGELACSHLFYHPSYAQTLRQRNVLHFFIYRDPRDVVVSLAHYLRYMNRWHRLHRRFRACASDSEAITLAIRGLADHGPNHPFPDINQRFRRYQPWIQHDHLLAIRFEDLMAADRSRVVHQIVTYYHASVGIHESVPTLAHNAQDNIHPKRSHTYREGKTGGWTKAFTEEHKNLFKELAGELLIELGYERDLNW